MGQIHKFAIRDTYIVLDVASGSIHELDRLAWDLLDYYGRPTEEILQTLPGYSPEEILEALQEIDDLVAQRQLFSEDLYRFGYTAPISELKSMCFNVSHDCNLRCRYCFAEGGPFGGQRGLMSLDVGKRGIDYLLEHSGGRPHVEVDFFGGEPLLNLAVVKGIMEYAKEKGREAGKTFQFTLTTNATLLTDEVIDFLNRENVNLVLSLDGRREVNDAMRYDVRGKGVYDQIVPRIQKVVQSRRHHPAYYYIRGTYTGKNLDFTRDVLHLADLGFDQLSVEPVIAAEGDYALRDEDIETIEKEYERLAEAYLARRKKGESFSFFHFNLELQEGPCLPRRLSGCGAGHDYLALTPEGDFYPCHQFVGREKYLMGNVFEGITRPDLRETFREAHVYNKVSCPSCWARFYCSGGCHANADLFHGDIMKPHELECRLQRKRLECAIYIKVRLAQDEAEGMVPESSGKEKAPMSLR
ncbi:MAG: thioether cross-link-forming SCIFF peptide maturase [Firmicutes bacterium]|nr:thioether cross-link-forming SCIFF peptide maturase [Bacillota bacterium]MCL5040226.1 thioether cross-link-forming SCIFF peptide maturase [Bacillota bacterium]